MEVDPANDLRPGFNPGPRTSRIVLDLELGQCLPIRLASFTVPDLNSLRNWRSCKPIAVTE
jgi:hypothetical protein